MKSKIAIVAGLGCGAAGSAALMKRGLRTFVEVFPRRPEEVLEFLSTDGVRFKQIYILQTWIEGDEAKAVKILKELKRKGVKISIAAMAVDPETSTFARAMVKCGTWTKEQVAALKECGVLTRHLHGLELLEYFTPNGGTESLEETIEKTFHVKAEVLSKIGEVAVEDRYFVGDVPSSELIAAGRWFRDSYGRDDVYNDVVHLLAEGDGKVIKDVLAAAGDDKRSVLVKEDWKTLVERLSHYMRFRRRGLIGESEAMRELRGKVRKYCRFPDARVLLLGESGTGKETVALQLHYGSARHERGRFQTFNCATLNADLIESRLFGYEKGAFTGANQLTKGLFEVADGGTLFLDEIGELGLEMQGLLLRVLEEGVIQRVGGTEEIKVDVRLITATNRDLVKMIKEGKFREDLYYRINTVQIRIPPLRDRKEDIDDIVAAWQAQKQKPNDFRLVPVTGEQLSALKDYEYPGNVRELLTLLERAYMTDEIDFRKIVEEHKQMNAGLWEKPSTDSSDAPENLKEAIRLHVQKIFHKYGDNITTAAEKLGVSRNTIRKYL